MRKYSPWYLLVLNLLILVIFISAGVVWNKTISVMTENMPIHVSHTIIIDPGHGGEDGGAVSITGIKESSYNLSFAQKLNDILRVLGYKTYMTREGDYSVYTDGKTLSAKKVSDLRKRVELINSLDDSVLISIHQNFYPDKRYSGAQVFYAPTDGSDKLAEIIQDSIIRELNKGSKRTIKPADGIYIMQNTQNIGVLVECGFLSNSEEEILLRDPEYQKKVCSIIATSVTKYLCNDTVT